MRHFACLDRYGLIKLATECERIINLDKTYIYPGELDYLINLGAFIVKLDVETIRGFYHEVEYKKHRFITLTKKECYNPELN